MPSAGTRAPAARLAGAGGTARMAAAVSGRIRRDGCRPPLPNSSRLTAPVEIPESAAARFQPIPARDSAARWSLAGPAST